MKWTALQLAILFIAINLVLLLCYNTTWQWELGGSIVYKCTDCHGSKNPPPPRPVPRKAIFTQTSTSMAAVDNSSFNAIIHADVYKSHDDGTVLHMTDTPSESRTKVQEEVLARNKYSEEQFLDLLKSRSSLLERECASLRNTTLLAKLTQTAYNHLLLMRQENIAWCPVFKAGSSTWLTHMLDLSKLSEHEKEKLRLKYPHAPLTMLKQLLPPVTGRSFAAHLRFHPDLKLFLLVRHPFDRIVSAFRDKLERHHAKVLEKDFYYKTYGRHMVARFRERALARVAGGHKYFSVENNYGAPVPVNGSRSSKLPIFWEFVQYLKSSPLAKMDEHWHPSYHYCSVCSRPLHYQAVIHFESLADEGPWLNWFLNPAKLLEHDRRLNPNPDPSGLGPRDLTRKYFQTLDEEDVRALYRIYRPDFKLFGYRYQFGNMSIPYD